VEPVADFDGEPWSCFAAADGNMEWSAEFIWKVDQERDWAITQFRILNAPTDPETLAEAEITVEGESCGTTPTSTEHSSWIQVNCSTPLSGLTMKITGLTGLQFCGLKAYGSPDAAELAPVGPE